MSAGLMRVGGGRVDWTVGSGPLGPPVLRIPTPRVACTDASRRESDTARHESRSPGARNGIADGAAGGAHGVGVAASMRAHAAWRGWLRCHRLRTSAKAGVARAGIASMHAVVGTHNSAQARDGSHAIPAAVPAASPSELRLGQQCQTDGRRQRPWSLVATGPSTQGAAPVGCCR